MLQNALFFPVQGQPDNERMMAAGVILGKWDRQEWNVPARNVDFYDLKGIIESVLANLGVENYAISRSRMIVNQPIDQLIR